MASKTGKSIDLSLGSLAQGLGIPDELIEHDGFMEPFKRAIVMICDNSSQSDLQSWSALAKFQPLKNVSFDLAMDRSLDSETTYRKILAEVRSNELLDTQKKGDFIDTFAHPPTFEKNHTAIRVDDKEGKVYIQTVKVMVNTVALSDSYHTTTEMTVYSTTEENDLIVLYYSERLDNKKQVVEAHATEYRYDAQNEEVSRRNIGK